MTPNRPGTPTTTFRLDPDLLARAKSKAAERGETITDVVRHRLREYAAGDVRHVTVTLAGGDTLDGGASWRCPCGAVNPVPVPRESGPVVLRCVNDVEEET